MNILWLTPQLPCLRSGGQVRQFYLLRWLAARHRITLVSLVQPEEQGALGDLRSWGVEVVTAPFEPRLASSRWANRLRTWGHTLLDLQPRYARTYPLAGLRTILAGQREKSFDVAHVEHLFAAPLIEALPGMRVVLTLQNVESHNAQREGVLPASFARRVQVRIEAGKLARWEQAWLGRAQCNVAVSNLDAAFFRASAPSVPVVVVPNGVDAEAFEAPDAQMNRRGIVFVGTLGYAANADAVDHLVAEIMPRVRSQVDVTLTVVGGGASPALLQRAQGHARFAGFVPDVRPFYWRAAVCAVPLRSGGGTRLKILEALAAGCAVVATTIGAEGLDLQPSDEIMIADTPEEFAAAVVRLLRDDTLRERLARRGRDAIRRRYDWSAVAPRMEEAYRIALEPAR